MEVQAPRCLSSPLIVPNKLLMGPGPSNSSPRVLHALSRPVVGHMHPEVFKIMDEIKEGIKYVFQTKNDLTLALSASGHAGMEAIMCNLLEPGDVALIAINGLWGARASKMATNYGAIVKTVETSLGESFDFKKIESALKQHRPKLLFIVQGESSTGVYQPLKGLGDLCHRYNCLLAVDTVASLGGVPFFMDRWGVDAVYTGSQKVLGAPAGLAPISFSARAQKVIFGRRTPVAVYYLDMKEVGQQWNCFDGPRIYHHTTCSNLLAALREGLALIAEEGLENVNARHQQCAVRLYQGIEELGLSLLVDDFHTRLPTVTAIKVPKTINWSDVTQYCMNTYSLEISGGLGPTAGKIFRIGLMGYNATPEKVDYLLRILKEGLEYAESRQNRKCKF